MIEKFRTMNFLYEIIKDLKKDLRFLSRRISLFKPKLLKKLKNPFIVNG